ELVRVGRHVFAEQDQVGVAIAFAKIAEDLIVGAVFADDVKHAFDLRKYLFGDLLGLRLVNIGFGVGAVRLDLRGVAREPRRIRRVDNRNSAGERRADIIVRLLRIGRRDLVLGLRRKVAVQVQQPAFARADENLLAVRRDGDGARIPGRRDEAEHYGLARIRD